MTEQETVIMTEVMVEVKMELQAGRLTGLQAKVVVVIEADQVVE